MWANLRPYRETLSSYEGSYTIIEGKVSFAIIALVVGYAACILIDGVLHLLYQQVLDLDLLHIQPLIDLDQTVVVGTRQCTEYRRIVVFL